MNDPLASYLHDHLAGSKFAVELLEKLNSEFSGTPTGDTAHQLLDPIESDRQILQQLIEKVGRASSDAYDAIGWIAERVSRLKLKHDDPTGFGTFEAFETLSLGILGKRSLWETLHVHQHIDPRVAGPDYPELLLRAEQQFQKSNQYRLTLAKHALARKENQS